MRNALLQVVVFIYNLTISRFELMLSLAGGPADSLRVSTPCDVRPRPVCSKPGLLFGLVAHWISRCDVARAIHLPRHLHYVAAELAPTRKGEQARWRGWISTNATNVAP